MPEIGSKAVADYLKSVIADFERDNDTIRLLRRLHIKEVHLRRRNHCFRRLI